MKTRFLIALVLTLLVALVFASVAEAVSGAAFTTFNPWVDGLFREVCKNSIINCNIYGSKPDVWLNGGPSANGLGPDGQYFFAVLVPGGQPDPNDGGAKNLSDDYDAYTNRQFTVYNGEVFYYGGTHDQDSGNFLDPDRNYCHKPRGCTPDGLPPLIRLYPYADTWNPGGVYILAICYIGDGSGYPVEPRDCKYDAFKVKEGPATSTLLLSGMKFEDMFADGKADWVEFGYMDPGLEGWTITIKGSGFLGEPIDEIIKTGPDGKWSYQKDYTYSKSTTLYDAVLSVCEKPEAGWTQSFPDSANGCHDLVIPPASLAEVNDLDFGNWYPGEKSGVKFEDLDADGAAREDGELGLKDWTIFVDYNANAKHDAGEPYAITGEDGSYKITGIKPGTWTVYEVLQEGWHCSFPATCKYEEEFTSSIKLYGNNFGNWYPAKKGGYKWYDRNGDGVKDEDEPIIPGWTISVWKDGYPVGTGTTNEFGYYEFTLKPGTYVVKEVCPEGWIQSYPDPGEGGCGAGVYEVTLKSRQEEKDNNFGNYRVGHADFGTKGYWHNQNGMAEICAAGGWDLNKAGLLAYINGLDPYNDPTGYFDNGEESFDGYDEFGNLVPAAMESKDFGPVCNEISQFLVDPNGGGDPREQLAQQLLAFIFNANYRLDDPAAAVFYNGVWYSAQGLIDQAVFIWSFGAPAEQTAMQELLDGLNNTDYLPFIYYYP